MNQLSLIDPQGYRIASLKHTSREDEFIDFWALNHRGYTPGVGQYCGIYNVDEAASLNDGLDCIAVRVEVIQTLLSPEPYYANQFAEKGRARWYDQRGPVVVNNAANWRVMIKDAQPFRKPKPEYFRGKRKAIYVE